MPNPTWKDYPDTSTPITAAALNTIESDIAAKIAKSLVDAKGDLLVGTADDTVARKAVGSNDKVLTAASGQSDGLIWQLIVNSMIDAAAAIAVSKLAGGSDGQYLKTVGSTPTWSAGAAAALTAGLPGSPSDGDEIILVDSTSAPTYSWRLRYVSAKASNKWVFIGGSPAFSQVNTAEGTTSTSYVALATAGPSLAIPVAGDYLVDIGFTADPNASANLQLYMSYDIGGTGAVDADFVTIQEANTQMSTMRAQKKSGLTAVTLTAKYKGNNGSFTATFSRRWMSVTPIAIGG